MTVFASVKRFCAIEGVNCEKSIPYQGSWTYFFAYPSTEPWRDFSALLANDLGSRGIYGKRWEDVVNNDLLFSKVCEGIYGHDFLLAEVTEPNPNVLLEIGYALAVGRQPILLKNKNHEEWSRNLLTTLESCYYETREDILNYISSLSAEERRISEQPDRRLPFLESMGIFDRPEVPGTVYHLKPKLSADWISGVDRTIRNSYFKLSTMDPSDSVSDEFYPQARQIRSAAGIVASLVSSKNVNWQQHNANVALLIGFAIGLGKQVLVLQESPLAPILDLGSVSRPVDTETQAGQVVQSWINVQTQLAVSQTAESRTQATVRHRVENLRQIYLGHPDALQDSRLFDYFVRTKEFEDAVEARRTIFIGRRGSGKSANFQAIKEELRQRPGIVTSEIAPDDFELERISDFLERGYSLTNQRYVFQNVWNYVIVTELLKSLDQDTDKLYLSPDDTLRSNLHQYYESNRQLLGLDFGTRVISVLTDYANSVPENTVEKPLVDSEAAIKSLRDYQIARQLKAFADREDITFFVVADDLDKHWRPDTRQSIDLLVGLIAEADRLQRFFGACLKVVMFLREDIYDVLAQYDDDLPKRSFLRMEWTPANLKHLVAERLASAAGQGNEDDESTWTIIFPHEVNGNPASDYILSRALPRPRDILDFCQKSIDQAQRNGHSVVTEQDILDGEAAFSESLFWSVATEFRGLYPNLENVLIEFAGANERLRWDDFEGIAEKAIVPNKEFIDAWIGTEDTDPQSLAEILFRVGVLGLSRADGGTTHFCNGRSFAETWGMVAPKPMVHIHPAFAKALDVSAGSVRPPVRSRRSRGADPRQLSFDVPA